MEKKNYSKGFASEEQYEADNFDNIFNGLAKQLGVKRYSEEYNRYLWVNILGVSPEVYDKNNR